MSLIGACLRRSIDRGVRKRRRDRFSLNWHFLLKDRFPPKVPASLAVGTVGPFRPRFRRESSHLVGRGQAVGSGGRSGSLYRGGQDADARTVLLAAKIKGRQKRRARDGASSDFGLNSFLGGPSDQSRIRRLDIARIAIDNVYATPTNAIQLAAHQWPSTSARNCANSERNSSGGPRLPSDITGVAV